MRTGGAGARRALQNDPEKVLIFEGGVDPYIKEVAQTDSSQDMRKIINGLTNFENNWWASVLHFLPISKNLCDFQIVTASLLINVKTPRILHEMQGLLSSLTLQYIPEYQVQQIQTNKQNVVLFGLIEIPEYKWTTESKDYLQKFQINGNFILVTLGTNIWLAVFLVGLIS